jgi:hypothetical protein
VRVIAGAPPASGPPKLEFTEGGEVSFKVQTDSPVNLEVVGLGQTRTFPKGKPQLWSFPARKAGLFAVIVTASHISVATIHVGK